MVPALTHYSDRPVSVLREHNPQDTRPKAKPHGFWVSVDEGGHGWPDFCRGDGWNIEGLAFVHDVKLRADANILVLTGAADLDDFTEGYGVAYPEPGPYASTYILWHRVAALYSGILIAPYVWSRRLDGRASSWYYGWDCASGCIWDVSVVESIAVREQAVAA